MADNMYDEKGLLKPKYGLTDSQKREMLYNNDIDKVDYRTDYGKGIYYKGVDGREYHTTEDLERANKTYWDSQKIDTSKKDSMIYYIGEDGREYHTTEDLERANKAYWGSQKIDTSKKDSMIYYIGKDGREYHTTEALERANKAYFDYLNSSFNTNDKNLSQDVFKARQEEILSYIRERYGDYLDKLLEEYGYGSQEAGKGPKK